MSVAEMKHKRFAKEVVKNGGNAGLAYHKIYPNSSRESSAVSASKLLKNDKIVEEISSYQRSISDLIGPQFIAKKLKSLCSAKKKIYYEGAHVDTDADNPTRMAAVRTVLQTQNALNDDSGPQQAQSLTVQINLVDV